jgi:lipopolysaccharide/colanic/teichoic acid biosynthesis glycosyltransferase
MKRLFDIVGSALGLLVASPVLVLSMALVWLQDRHSPFHVAKRVGRDGVEFRMVKLRSMVVNADRSKLDSTAADDRRITPIGHLIRRFKVDELTQLWNVLVGDMSLVGPRPNVKRETDLYTTTERRLLSVKPGITDFSSIVFADEGEILVGQSDPAIAYSQLIRPGKGHLGLFYVDNHTLGTDIKLCFLTAVAIVSRSRALRGVQSLLAALGASPQLVEMAGRSRALVPLPPPGADRLVTSRDGNPFA